MEIRPREPVIFAVDYEALIAWYCDVLGFKVQERHDDKGYHYANLVSDGGYPLGIALAEEMSVTPADRANNSSVLQVEVDDVKVLLEHVKAGGGSAPLGPSFDPAGGFWFGAFADCEGNQWWVVDKNCP